MNARVVPAGDAALIVEFDEVIDPVVNARAIAVSVSRPYSEVRGGGGAFR